MVDLITAFLVGAAATFTPLYGGIIVPRFAPQVSGFQLRKEPFLLAAAASGILFWFLLDVMNDAVLLDINQSFGIGVTQDMIHIALIILFVVGVVFLFGLEEILADQGRALGDKDTLRSSARINSPDFHLLTYSVAVAVALGIGFHAFGEGIQIGAVIPSSPSILEAIGGSTTSGIYAGTAYVLHKLLEGFVVGVVALLASSVSLKRMGVLGLISGLPTVIGFFVGVFGPVSSIYFFALGGAGTIYAELKLVPLFADRRVRFVVVIAFLLGFFAMYTAGLFHSLLPLNP